VSDTGPMGLLFMNLVYVIVKIWQRNASENVQASNKMASQMNIAT